MLKFNKKKTRAFAITAYTSGCITLIPTIQTELNLIPNSVFTDLTIKKEFYGEGNNIRIYFLFLWIVIDFGYWWKFKK